MKKKTSYQQTQRLPSPWYSRSSLYELVFGTRTKAGRNFDKLLIAAVVASVIVVFADTSVHEGNPWKPILYGAEWFFTGLFTIEYLLRIYCSPRRLKYIFSLYGLIDLLSFLPTYLSLAFVGTHYMLVIRLFRLTRMFKVFQLSGAIRESHTLYRALINSTPKIFVFMIFVLILVSILGSFMFVIEGRVNPMFNSIPRSIYWAIITITTVGYGDITPITNIGQFISTVVMLLGYSIIAVPTGIVSAEYSMRSKRSNRRNSFMLFGNEPNSLILYRKRKAIEQQQKRQKKERLFCFSCGYRLKDTQARYCSRCGKKLQYPQN